jgi:hypothetical protein
MATEACTTNNIDLLAGAFIGELSKGMTKAQFYQFLHRTRTDFQVDVCHSHDYLDANMAMHAAFVVVFRHEPQMDSDEDCTLINLAWTRAKRFIAGV